MPRLLPLLFVLPLAPFAFGQSSPPDEAAKRMKLPPGFTATAVAAEPTIRQPLSISFDGRGRLWVLQYLQYPNPAGLSPVKQDQYLRTVWGKVPEPPPKGPKGADRITILSDPDGRGVYRKSKDFLTGLNLASGFCLGHGGVFVVQPPYLLFYPDRDGDDVPDTDTPDVLLTGFGMEDTHSLANSLQWGPDGWLYGAAGSTSTCKIRNPARPADPVVEFQQGVWRYHPRTRQFELFSEGGGNTYGLDFDRHGQVIAGTNWGGFAVLHQLQGAYHVKGFAKHGPLHNPYAFGYFDHVPYTGFKGGHVTCGGILYQGDTFPPEYREQYVAGNLLSNAVYWHKLQPNGSTFTAQHGGDLMTTTDSWFRPVDLTLGPDGSVYVADWTDKRAAHLDPVDNWDKTNGRVFKIEYAGTPKLPPFDLSKKSSGELVQLLGHPSGWWRREARRVLAERRDAAVYSMLRGLIDNEKEQLPLEALWALYASGGWRETDFTRTHAHPNEHIRAWGVRFLGDAGVVELEVNRKRLRDMTNDPSPVVLAQLACSARRLPAAEALDVCERLAASAAAAADPYIPLLVWWAVESKIELTGGAVFPHPERLTSAPMGPFLAERVARRAAYPSGNLVRLVGDFLAAPSAGNAPAPPARAALAGIDAEAKAGYGGDDVRAAVAAVWAKYPRDEQAFRVAAKLGVRPAEQELDRRVADHTRTDPDRAKWVVLAVRLGRLPPAAAFAQMATMSSEAARRDVLTAAAAVDSADTPNTLLAGYPNWPKSMKQAAVQALLSRPAWANTLLAAVDAGTFPKADLTLDHARTATGLNDPGVTKLVEKHWGKLTAATSGEKQARIAWLSTMLGRVGPPDLPNGKKLFTQHCATCHSLHGEGGKVGPDLTTADRKNRGYMLAQIVDPSGYIRPEYISHKVTTTDGRTLTGLVTAANSADVTLVNVVEDKEVRTVIPRGDIESLTPLAVSLMPEKLLDTLKYEEVGDLFAYLAADKK